MNDVKNINSNYPMTTLEFPQIVFHDATNQEKQAINKIKNHLAQQLFFLDASEDLNVMLEYVNEYPNTTFTLSAEEEYNDEGYDTRVRVRYSCNELSEESAIENTEANYYFAEKLHVNVIEKANGMRVSRENLATVAKRLLGENLGEQWFLGKVGLEKKHLDQVVNDPQTEAVQYKL